MISVSSYVTEMEEKVDELVLEAQHTTKIFPEDTNETCQLVAGGSNNVWSAWTNIVDNNAVTLLSKFGGVEAHISVFNVEQTSASVIYIAEICCDGVLITAVRFKGGAVPKQSQRIYNELVPAACAALQYRMKCATGGATANVSFRWHGHS